MGVGAGPLDLAGLRIDVVPTPGHSSDSLSFHLPADESMLTGDTVLGRSAPAILDPDGRVDEFIDSLRLIGDLLASREPLILPGHGPVVTEATVRAYLHYLHDRRRLARPVQIDA